jgi:hypothetical protein
MLPEIDFQKVRTVGGSRNLGFEELVVQLFRLRYGRECEFNRVGGRGGDGGVEAFWQKKYRGTIGLQAKYVPGLNGRKSQFDRSIKSALENHPTLCAYIFVLPFDRHSKKGERDDFKTWAKWVDSWHKYASQRHGNKRLLVKWCGAEEVRGMLLDLQARGLVDYYFGLQPVNYDDLRKKFGSAVASLEDRYTEGINIETSAEQHVQAFFGLPAFQKEYRQFVNVLRKKADGFLSTPPGRPCTRLILSKTAEVRRRWHQLRPRLMKDAGITPFTSILPDLVVVGELMNVLQSDIKQHYGDSSLRQRALWEEYSRHPLIEKAEGMCRALGDTVVFLRNHVEWGKKRLLIRGEAGTGKSHLLAQVGYELWKVGHPTVLLLGERFRTQDDPWKQAMRILGFDGNASTWLGLLNTLAEARQRTGVILVDAINESDCCKLWNREIQAFADRLQSYPALKLVVTCRSDFASYCLPESLVKRSDESWAYLDHYGFDVDVIGAVEHYFRTYNVTSQVFPPTMEEFELPLFLKIFCKTYEGREVQACHLSLSRVLKDHKQHVAQTIAKSLTCDECDVHRAVGVICDEMVRAGGSIVPMDAVRDKINSLIQAPDASKSLFSHLRSSGLIRQIGPNDEDPQVTFGFERLYDFHVAQKMLDDYPEIGVVKEDFQKKGRLYGILMDERQWWRSRGLIGAFSVLFPERFGIELIDLLGTSAFEIWRAFCESIRWRRADCITDRTEEILRIHRADSVPFIIENFLDLAAVPDKRFNADYLHSKLVAMSMTERETEWTLRVSRETFYNQDHRLNRFVEWCSKVPSERLSSEQARLSGVLLSWCFSSTHVPFRDKATSAAIHVLRSHPDVVGLLLDSFARSDDPYIRERIYAVAAGVAMRCSSPADVRGIATKVFQLFFNAGEVNPHILMRDYARCVMERALFMGALPEGVAPAGFRPSYKSAWPEIRTTDNDIENLAHEDHAWCLTSSMVLESEGNYGDFGRYEFGDRISQFSRFKHDEAYSREDANSDFAFDAKVARRYLFDRVLDLGWTPNGLGKREQSLFPGYSSRARPTVERISKKYQWIGLHEMLGYLSDHYQPHRWSCTEEGSHIEARDLFCRDFDPSASPPTLTPRERHAGSSAPWWCDVDDPLNGPSDASQWIFSDKLPKITRILHPTSAEGDVSWLALCGYYEWSDYANVRQVDDEAPYKHLGLRVLSWVIPNARKTRILGELRASHLYGRGWDVPTLSDCWMGEYPWAPACQTLGTHFVGRPKSLSRVRQYTLTAGLIGQSSWLAPAPQILSLLEASWAQEAADFTCTCSSTSKVIVTNPTTREGYGPEVCLVDKAVMAAALAKNRLSLVWVVLAERTVHGGETWAGSFEFSGVYWLERGLIKGGITHKVKRLPRS